MEREEKEEERGLAIGIEWMPRHFKEAWKNTESREAINSELNSDNQNNSRIEAKLPELPSKIIRKTHLRSVYQKLELLKIRIAKDES